eukprot:767310-Ditylum_brightwellii.AAC.1
MKRKEGRLECLPHHTECRVSFTAHPCAGKSCGGNGVEIVSIASLPYLIVLILLLLKMMKRGNWRLCHPFLCCFHCLDQDMGAGCFALCEFSSTEGKLGALPFLLL